MDITVEKSIDTSRNLERQLSTLLSANNVSYSQVEDTLSKICAACSTALLYDFESALAQHAEDRIWDSHVKINGYYRAALEKLKMSKDPTPVARRKLEGSYLRFIKNAQKFYRGYVRELAAVHGNVPELERAARKVGNETQAKHNPRKQIAQRAHLLESLHTTLIHLGDLSRYRESELGGDKRNWGPAVGFYDLATSILPTSGISYNQLAVIALADGNFFRASYQLYRALSAKEPHPQADTNLRRAFYKISAAWKSNELSTVPAMTAGASLPRGLVAVYLRLLSTYYHGKVFSEREELENEVLTQLAVDLRSRPTESSPVKMVMINIAAGHAAEARVLKSGGTDDFLQSYLFFLRLNIRAFLTLLTVFETELENCEAGAYDQTTLNKLLTPCMQRALPVLRLYTAWLYKNIIVLGVDIDATFAPLQAELWTLYARTLTLINEKFPPQYLPQPHPFMFGEDEETVGFDALHCAETRNVWYDDKILKPMSHDMPNKPKDPSIEMLLRMRDLLFIGVRLAHEEKRAPIELADDGSGFVYIPASTTSTTSTTTAPPGLPAVASQPSQERTTFPNPPPIIATEAYNIPPANDEFHSLDHDIEAEANAMVNSLVGLDDDLGFAMTSHNHRSRNPVTPPSLNSTSPFSRGTHTVSDLLDVVQSHSQPGHISPLPVFLPGLGHSPKQEGRSPTNGHSMLESPGANAFVGWGTPQQPQHSRPGTATQPAPLVPPGLGHHSRANSTESVASPWMPNNTWSTFAPTDSMRSNRRSLLDRSLGNGTFGISDITTRRESQHGRIGSFSQSPMLAGGDGWATPERSAFGQVSTPLYERQMSFSGAQTTPSANPIGSIGSGRPRPIK